MKFKSALVVAAIVAAIPLTTVAASATELVNNGGFETGSLSPWVSSDNGWTVTDSTSYGGSYSAVSGGNHSLVQYIDYVDTNSIHSISFAASTKSMEVVFIYVGCSFGAFGGCSEFANYVNVRGDNSWERYNVTSSLHLGRPNYELNLLYAIGFDGTGYLDNVSITVGVPESSTWVMMLAGFAGLGVTGYRRNKAAQLAA